MSSVLTKTIISGLVSLAWSGKLTDICSAISANSAISPISAISAIQGNMAFLGTYGAMVAYDMYDFCTGEIKTITMKDSEGNFIEKEYRLKTGDWVKYAANALPAGLVFGTIFDQDAQDLLQVYLGV